MSHGIRIVNSADEFIQILRSPGEKSVLFMPKEYKTVGDIDILEKYKERIVYADVFINAGIAIHPSFSDELIASQFQFVSPLYYSGSKQLYVQADKISNMTDLTKQLFSQLPGHHIATPLYAII